MRCCCGRRLLTGPVSSVWEFATLLWRHTRSTVPMFGIFRSSFWHSSTCRYASHRIHPYCLLESPETSHCVPLFVSSCPSLSDSLFRRGPFHLRHFLLTWSCSIFNFLNPLKQFCCCSVHWFPTSHFLPKVDKNCKNMLSVCSSCCTTLSELRIDSWNIQGVELLQAAASEVSNSQHVRFVGLQFKLNLNFPEIGISRELL